MCKELFYLYTDTYEEAHIKHIAIYALIKHKELQKHCSAEEIEFLHVAICHNIITYVRSQVTGLS